MSFLAFVNTYICYTTGQPAAKDAYLATQVTPLAARFYGAWTAVSAILRLIAAYRIQEKGLYLATLGGFVITCLNFVAEVTVYETTSWGSVGLGLGLDVFTVVWMSGGLF
jgi:hypothetical protein